MSIPFKLLLVLPVVLGKFKDLSGNSLCQTAPPALWCENEGLAKECGWDLACQE